MQTGWKEAEAQEVPPEASALSEYINDLETTFRSTVEVCGRKALYLHILRYLALPGSILTSGFMCDAFRTF